MKAKPHTFWNHPTTWRDPATRTKSQRACTGKVSYPSKKNATARAKVIGAEHGDPTWNAYRCPNCHRWHIGHNNQQGRRTLAGPDESRVCADCHQLFVFTESQQAFFAQRGWAPPKRCSSCRESRKVLAGFVLEARAHFFQ